MTGPRKFVLLALLLTMLGHARPAWAQFTSAIEGTVFDPSGLVTPGATVTLSNLDTGVSQSATSSGAGYFRFPALPTDAIHSKSSCKDSAPARRRTSGWPPLKSRRST